LYVFVVKAASIVVVDYRLRCASIDVVLVLPSYQKCLVWSENNLSGKLGEPQYLNDVSNVDFLVKFRPGINKLLVFKFFSD
jgi:hypothetical protein